MPKPTPLEDAFTSAFMNLRALRHVDVDVPLDRDTNQLDFAVGRLCEALSDPDPEDDVNELARRAHRVVLTMAQALDRTAPVELDDRRARDKLQLARGSVAALLDELGGLVSGADRALRDVLLRGVSVEDALRRIHLR